jgi:hypothetical protein
VAISTYAQLNSAVLNWINRGDAETVLRVPEWITLAEAEMKRRLRHEIVREAITLDAAEVDVPAAAQDVQSLRLNTGAQNTDRPIDPRTYDELIWLRTRLSPTGAPRYFARVADSLLLAPAPDDTYTGEIVYVSAFVPLDSSDSSTWGLLQAYPDLYLYGALSHAAGYLEHDGTTWQARFDTAIEQINEARQKKEAELQNQPVRLARVFG